MTEGDFGFHAIWKNLVDYLETVDVDALRKKCGVGETGIEAKR